MVPNIIIMLWFSKPLKKKKKKIPNLEKRFPIWKYSMFEYVYLF